MSKKKVVEAVSDKHRLGSVYPKDSDLGPLGGAGARDAFHVPGVLVEAAVALRAGQAVRFVSPQLVHPCDVPVVIEEGACDYCCTRNVPLVAFRTSEPSEKVCEDCVERDERSRFTRIDTNTAAQAIVDPLIGGEVTPGDFVWALPLPAVVGKVTHAFDLKGVAGAGKFQLVTDEDLDYLNDSCRGCYD